MKHSAQGSPKAQDLHKPKPIELPVREIVERYTLCPSELQERFTESKRLTTLDQKQREEALKSVSLNIEYYPDSYQLAYNNRAVLRLHEG